MPKFRIVDQRSYSVEYEVEADSEEEAEKKFAAFSEIDAAGPSGGTDSRRINVLISEIPEE